MEVRFICVWLCWEHIANTSNELSNDFAIDIAFMWTESV